jgi:hypothetical protein
MENFNYYILNLDRETADMKFKIKNKDKHITINLIKDDVLGYSGVHPTDHWVNTITGDIVIISDIHNRIFTVIDNECYRHASQFDYDRWEHKLRPDSDNAKVFAILRSRHISQ